MYFGQRDHDRSCLFGSWDVISLGGVPIVFDLCPPKFEIDSLDLLDFDKGDSKPTKITEIQSIDKFIDLFKTSDD